MSAVPTRPRQIYPTKFKIAAAVILAVVAVLSVIAYLMLAEESEDNAASEGGFVEETMPADDSEILQQATVGIDLATGWQGELIVGGQPVPEDQLQVTEALNRIEFTPGEGKVVESWPAGRQCVGAVVWESAVGPETGSRNVSWCFDVL